MNTTISHSASDRVGSDILTSAPVATQMETCDLDILSRKVVIRHSATVSQTWQTDDTEWTSSIQNTINFHFSVPAMVPEDVLSTGFETRF